MITSIPLPVVNAPRPPRFVTMTDVVPEASPVITSWSVSELLSPRTVSSNNEPPLPT